MIRFQIIVNTLDTMHVGSGAFGLGTSSIAAVQRSQGKPIIPGSTLRGKLRWNMKRLVPILRRAASGQLSAYLQRFPKDASVVADFFGAEDHRGKVVVSDGILVDDTSTGVVPGVRLNSKTRTVERGALFFHEVLPPGSKFIFEIILDAPSSIPKEEQDVDTLLLLLLAKTLEKEGIGRKRARVTVDLGEYESILDDIKEGLLRSEQ